MRAWAFIAALVVLITGVLVVHDLKRRVRRWRYRRPATRQSIEVRMHGAIANTAACIPHSLVIATIVQPGEQPKMMAFGGGGETSAEDTAALLFEVGSITKVFTAFTLARLVTTGRLALDARLADVAPEWFGQDPGWAALTVEDLATHTAGLPRLPPRLLGGAADTGDPYRNFDLTALRAAIAATHPRRRRRYRYSNFGYGLLGELCAVAAGATFKTLAAERAITPLGLHDTSYLSDLEPPTLMSGRRKSGRIVPHWHFDALAGAGGLVSSARDLTRLVQRCLQPPEDWRAVVELCLTKRRRIDRRRSIGLAWHCHSDFVTEHDIWWHNGATAGHRAIVALAPRVHVGVAVLSNSSPFDFFSANIDRLAFQLLRHAIKLQR